MDFDVYAWNDQRPLLRGELNDIQMLTAPKAPLVHYDDVPKPCSVCDQKHMENCTGCGK